MQSVSKFHAPITTQWLSKVLQNITKVTRVLKPENNCEKRAKPSNKTTTKQFGYLVFLRFYLTPHEQRFFDSRGFFLQCWISEREHGAVHFGAARSGGSWRCFRRRRAVNDLDLFSLHSIDGSDRPGFPRKLLRFHFSFLYSCTVNILYS